MKNPLIIICIDNDPSVLNNLKISLGNTLGQENLIENFEGSKGVVKLVEELRNDDYEVALVLAGAVIPDLKGDDLLNIAYFFSNQTLKIRLTGDLDLEATAKAIRYAKLYRYLGKPCPSEDLKLTVIEAIHSYLLEETLKAQNRQLQELNQQLEKIICDQAAQISEYTTAPEQANQEWQHLSAINRQQTVLVDELLEKQYQLTQFLERMPVGVAVFNDKGVLEFLNYKARQLFGKGVVPLTTAEQMPEVYQLYFAGTNQLYFAEKLVAVKALKGENATLDDIEIHQGEKIIPIESWGTPIFNELGDIAYAIVAFHDITQRKKAEAEHLRSLQEFSQVNQAYASFVPHQFLQLLNKPSITDVQLGDHVQQEMSVLFSDIRSFSTLSESMTPEENFEFINTYLSRMESAITENHGFIDKYMGDGIMALFNESANHAVNAGIAMLTSLADYNQSRQNLGHPAITVGIGINTGSLMLGTVGGKNRMDSTVISDGVNLASRLEELTKRYGVPLLITHHTYWKLDNPLAYAIRLIDRVPVKGKSEMVTVYEIFDADEPQLREGKLITRSKFEQALVLYNLRYFSKASVLFQECLRLNPGDSVAQIYLGQCQLHTRLSGVTKKMGFKPRPSRTAFK
ncbi:MAG: diguanylate cyclase [Moorea sp. SIO4A3]|nr:diguanylate cyclase [Moorena sp. SIO4A3]